MTDTFEKIADLVEGGGEAMANSDAAERAEPRGWGFDVQGINRDHALVLMGSKAIVVKEQPSGPIEDRVRLLSPEAVNTWFSNRFTEIIAPDGKVKAVTWARAWFSHAQRRQFAGIEFFPNPDGAKSTPNYLNLWRGFDVDPVPKGSYGVFRDHLFNNVCGSDKKLFDYVFAWFAHIVQRPRERVGTALILRGRMGTGKTKIGEVFGSLFAAHYFQVDDARYITGQFNAHMASCLLLQAEEAVWAGDKAAEGRLKGLITSECQMIESKGIDPIRIRNYVRLLMTSNEDWVVPAGKDERRFCVLDVHPRCAQNHDYFREMDEELNNGGRARLLHDLLHHPLDGINLRQIPHTKALLEQKLRSLDPIENWWWSRLVEGIPARGVEGWPAQITTRQLYEDYVRSASEIGVHRKRNDAEFGLKLGKLIPGLKKFRPRLETDPGVVRRVWSYEMPSLHECRTDFDRVMGQPFDWPTDTEGEREEADFSDDPIPV